MPKKLYLAAAVVWCCAIAVCCLISIKHFEDADVIPNEDKYVHFTFYFIFTILWYGYFKREEKDGGLQLRTRTFILAVLFGIGIEVCQQFFTTDRSADIADVLANTSGSLVATGILWIVSKMKK